MSLKKDRFEYKGAIHIHTIFSDGTGNIEEIAKIAKKCKLDFLIITDHNNLDVKEGIYNGVTVVKGEEISPQKTNHYLALNIKNVISPDQGVKSYINEVREQGGFGIAAHPFESTNRKNKANPIIWTDVNNEPDGIEIWNRFSDWGDNYNDKNIFTTAYSYFFRNKLITAPQKEALVWWDMLNNKYEKVIPATAGADAHALKITDYIIPLYVFPYKTFFNSLINVIFLKEKLSDDFEIRKQQIFSAIQRGNNVIINKNIYKSVPQIYISNNEEKAYSGECIAKDENTKLNIKLKKKLNIRILCNGVEVLKLRNKYCCYEISEKGKYRVEITAGKKGVIYTNPICVI